MRAFFFFCFFFFFNDTATTEIYTLSHTTLFRSPLVDVLAIARDLPRPIVIFLLDGMGRRGLARALVRLGHRAEQRRRGDRARIQRDPRVPILEAQVLMADLRARGPDI